MKRAAIIGAGRFGLSLAEALAENGTEVLLLDRNSQIVQNALKKVTWSMQCDATSESALEAAGIRECDVAVVAIGSNVETSMLATSLCKEMGVKMVVAKATSELHGKILTKLGADKVIYPDIESANRLARTLTDHGAIDLLELSEGFSLAEIDVPEDFAGKTLVESEMRRKTGVTVLCIRRLDEKNPKKPRSVQLPNAEDVLRVDDKLIVFGKSHDIDQLGLKD